MVLFLAGALALRAPQNPPQADDSPKTGKDLDPGIIPQGPLGDSIRIGLQVFNDTPKYAAAYVGNKMSCGHCHLGSGTVAYAMPLVGVPSMFPAYREREKEV